jgi:hypothetical protein
MNDPPGEVTALLARVKCGDQDAMGKLMPLVYRELRRLAGHYMRGSIQRHDAARNGDMAGLETFLDLTEAVIGSAFEVANVLGAGFLEKV